MPDIHWGYGFCIGGVCATDPAEGGVISPGGVGYDINCGVRLVKTEPLPRRREAPHPRARRRGCSTPSRPAAGKGGRYRFDSTETRRLMGEGPRFVVDRNLGVPRDLDHTEAHGRIDGRRPGRSLGSRRQARLGAVRHARLAATTSSKCRSSITSSTRTWPRCSGWN